MEGLATSKQVAAYLGVHPQSMDRWASRGEGPPFVKLAGIRRYDWADVRAWIESNRINPAGPRWICSTCKKRITSKGHLIVSIDHAVQDGGADWGIFHNDCERQATPNPYEIDIEEALTWPQLGDWIAHLLEKDWAHQTDLSTLLRRAGATR